MIPDYYTEPPGEETFICPKCEQEIPYGTKLYFDENGEFRIMVISDMHINRGGMKPSDLKVIQKMVELPFAKRCKG